MFFESIKSKYKIYYFNLPEKSFSQVKIQIQL